MVEQSSQKQRLLKELVGKDQEANGINFSPEKIADPINKNLKNRYQGLIEEEESESLTVGESNEIFKQIEEGKSISEIDMDQVVINEPTQKNLGIFSRNTLSINRQSFSVSSFIIAPIPIALLTLILRMIFIQKKVNIWRYLWGEDGFFEQTMEKMGLAKPKVSETAIFLHNRTLENAKILAKYAQSVDNNKFSNNEFWLFAKIKFCLEYNQEEYEGLKHSINLFKSAVKAHKAYVIIS